MHLSPVEVLSSGGTAVRAVQALQGAETSIICHVDHSQQANMAGSAVARCPSAQQGENKPDFVPILFFYFILS